MLTPKKKIVRKEMKQDTLLTTYVRTTGFYYENKKYINYALTALFVIVVAAVIYINNRRSNNEKANAELAKVVSLYDAGTVDPGQFQLAIDGLPEQGVMGLRSIVGNYGATEAGEMAAYYLANALYHTGNWTEAADYYVNFSAPDRNLKASARGGAGSCYEALKEYATAADLYEDAVKAHPTGIRAAEFMFAAARAHALAGEGADATRLLNALKEEYPGSEYALDADRITAKYSL